MKNLEGFQVEEYEKIDSGTEKKEEQIKDNTAVVEILESDGKNKVNIETPRENNDNPNLGNEIINEEDSKKIEETKSKVENLFNNLTAKLSSNNKYTSLVKGFGCNPLDNGFYVNFNSSNQDVKDIISDGHFFLFGSEGLEDILTKISTSINDAKEKTEKFTEKLNEFNSRNFFYKFLHGKEGMNLLNARHSAAVESRRLESVEDVLKSIAEFINGMNSVSNISKRDFYDTATLPELKKHYLSRLDKNNNN